MLSEQLENIDKSDIDDRPPSSTVTKVYIPHDGTLTGLAFGDLHSGHCVGFTPLICDSAPHNTYSTDYKLYRVRRECYDFVMEEVEKLRPIDFAIIPGDCVDGHGEKGGGRELILKDPNDQIECASIAIKEICGPNCDKVMTYGTPYHTGKLMDFERQIAANVGALKIGNHDFCSVRGVVFDYKHKIGSSSVPHGIATSILKARLWAQKWNLRGEYPLANVLLRGHGHDYLKIELANESPEICIKLPALQAYGSTYGARECEKTVDFGFVFFRIYENGHLESDKRIMRFDNRGEVVKLCQ